MATWNIWGKGTIEGYVEADSKDEAEDIFLGMVNNLDLYVFLDSLEGEEA